MTAKQQKAVQVRYVGNATRRTVDEYEWRAENGYLQTVSDMALVARLVANGGFLREPDTEHGEDKEQGT